MSDQPRALPDRPNLRFLKVEAKRRLGAGEFATLRETQLAIAREHGFSSWTALKQSVESAALAHVRWLVARFRDADGPAWAPPGKAELLAHVDEDYLTLVPTLVDILAAGAERLRADLVVHASAPGRVRATIADVRIDAEAEPEPPHRLTMLRIYPIGPRVTDERAGAPVTVTSGAVPAGAAEILAESVAELGLPGLVVAGASWAAARGWADLDRGVALRTDHRFPAHGITKVVTATTVLRLVAAGRLGLDAPANEWLRTIRLADDTVTVRELLTNTGGVASSAEQFAERVPAAGALESVVDCGNQRGAFVPSNAGYAVLGQLIADVTGEPYPDAVASLVFAPLDLRDSSFPTAWPGIGAVAGYQVSDDGAFEPAPAHVCTMPAAGGLWTTANDLARFGHGWRSLLPTDLAAEALRPQVTQAVVAGVGLGWLVHASQDRYGHPGGGPGGATSLLVRLSDDETAVACANRHVPVEAVAARLI